MIDDPERCYRALASRDARFDGWFVVGVTSTGIYCRPSCPATTPGRDRVRFFHTSAQAQAQGFRSCKRCRPDATPGSPEWDRRADLAGRAMRLVADGTVDREGVAGLARRLGYSTRQLNRHLLAEVGAGPQALARAQRAQNARVLLETTALPVTEVAFAAGFGSTRQFNDTIRAVFDRTPTELRAAGPGSGPTGPGTVRLRLPFRAPLATADLFGFLAQRAIEGVEAGGPTWYHRSLDLPHAPGTARIETAGPTHLTCTLRLGDLRDLPAAVQRCRRTLDLDADPEAVDALLGHDDVLGPLVRARPGLRSPGTADGHELAVRAMLGQQVSVAAARSTTAGLVARLGIPLPTPDGPVTHLFPRPEALAETDPATLPMPNARGRAVVGLSAAIASGRVVLDPGADREAERAHLRDLPGVGPWTEDYIAMRALGDPDVLLTTDLGIHRALERLGLPASPRVLAATGERWRPWRTSATMHLWSSS